MYGNASGLQAYDNVFSAVFSLVETSVHKRNYGIHMIPFAVFRFAAVGKTKCHCDAYVVFSRVNNACVYAVTYAVHAPETVVPCSAHYYEYLLTAPAAGKILFLHAVFDYVRHCYQYLVSAVVTVGIVHPFKIVDIAECNAVFVSAFVKAVKEVLQAVTVVKTSEGVVHSRVAELFVRAVKLADKRVCLNYEHDAEYKNYGCAEEYIHNAHETYHIL